MTQQAPFPVHHLDAATARDCGRDVSREVGWWQERGMGCTLGPFATREEAEAATLTSPETDPLDDFNYVGSRHHY